MLIAPAKQKRTERNARIVRWYAAGKPIRAIARAVRLTPQQISNILDATGARKKPKRGKIPPNDLPHLADLRAVGKTLQALADRYGISREAMRQALFRYKEKTSKKAA